MDDQGRRGALAVAVDVAVTHFPVPPRAHAKAFLAGPCAQRHDPGAFEGNSALPRRAHCTLCLAMPSGGRLRNNGQADRLKP
jgi:hypothetical protein